MTERHKEVFRQIAEMTKPLCDGTAPGGCRVPHLCCDSMYCEDAIHNAKKAGEPLELPRHDPRLPLMGPNGCVAPAHLRPVCTVHVCCINNLGFNPHDLPWTDRYYALRNEIVGEL